MSKPDTTLRQTIQSINHGGIDADGSTDTDRILALITAEVRKAQHLHHYDENNGYKCVKCGQTLAQLNTGDVEHE